VRKAIFKADPNKGGFIRAMLAPVCHKQAARFGWTDMALLVAIVVSGFLVARFLLAH
jgi:hypothetical protein